MVLAFSLSLRHTPTVEGGKTRCAQLKDLRLPTRAQEITAGGRRLLKVRPGPFSPIIPGTVLPKNVISCTIACAVVACLSLGCGRTVNDVLREAQSGSPEDIEAAISVLGQLLVQKERSKIEFDAGDRAALDFLRQVAVESSLRTHRALAIAALSELQSIEATDIFVKALDDELWLARLNGVRALRLHARDEFVSPLEKRLGKETEIDVRIEIVKALAAIGNDEAIEALRGVYRRRTTMPKDEDIHALRALRQLTGEFDPEVGEYPNPAPAGGRPKETSSSPDSTTRTDGDRS